MTRRRAVAVAFLSIFLPAGFACVDGDALHEAADAGAAERAERRPVRLTILHVNDTHGWILPRARNEKGEPTGTPRIARAATIIRRIREEGGEGAEEGDEGATRHALLLHGGDAFRVHGKDRLASKTRGLADFALMNHLRFDAMVLGNHETDFGLAHLRFGLALAGFRALSANVREKATGELLVEPTTVLEAGPVKVGLLGLSPTYGSKEATFDDPVETARALVPALREKVDIVVALTHIGIETDRKLAAAVAGIDLIVGGHSHTALPRGERVARAGGGDTLIVQARYRWEHLGRVDVTLTPKPGGGYQVTTAEAKLIPVSTSDAPPDAVVLDLIEELERKAKVAKPAGKTGSVPPPGRPGAAPAWATGRAAEARVRT